jgi:hypothetical protein
MPSKLAGLCVVVVAIDLVGSWACSSTLITFLQKYKCALERKVRLLTSDAGLTSVRPRVSYYPSFTGKRSRFRHQKEVISLTFHIRRLCQQLCDAYHVHIKSTHYSCSLSSAEGRITSTRQHRCQHDKQWCFIPRKDSIACSTQRRTASLSMPHATHNIC